MKRVFVLIYFFLLAHTYTPEEIAKSKAASTFAFDYPYIGLPMDVLLFNDSEKAALLELYWLEPHLYKLSVEEQARYADLLFRAKIADSEWIDMVVDTLPEKQHDSWLETSIGNVAYISLFAPTEEQRGKAKKALDEYVEWRKKEFQQKVFPSDTWYNRILYWPRYLNTQDRPGKRISPIFFINPLDLFIADILYYTCRIHDMFYPGSIGFPAIYKKIFL